MSENSLTKMLEDALRACERPGNAPSFMIMPGTELRRVWNLLDKGDDSWIVDDKVYSVNTCTIEEVEN